jgi:inner membrane protein
MDPVTQGAIGAIVAAAAAPAKRVRLAVLVGWAGGMLADADILIRSASDPLLNIEYHRHFSHSLLFIPIGAMVCAAMFWVFARKRFSFRGIYLYSFLGYSTAGLLDACTSYGTQLLWPFSNTRIAWNVVSVVDPIFTCVILGLVVYGFAKRHAEANWVACAFALAYLGFGAVQNRQAAETLTDLAESRGHDDAERFTVKPSIGNLALWRGIYDFENRYYVDGIRVDYLGSGTRVYPGGSVEKVDLGSVKETLSENSILSKDVDRFYWFSDGYLGWHPERQNIIGDVRYAVLPTSTIPLWGIEIEAVHENHAPFIHFRTTDKDTIDRLWKMIIGRDL